MPVVPSVQRQMTFSGDYGMDKWITYKTYSLTVSGSGSNGLLPIPHNLGDTPLLYTQWSETADFSTPREIGHGFGDLYPASEPWIIIASADTVNIYFYFQNWGSSSKTIYFRSWGLPKASSLNKVSTTSTISGLSPFVFNGEQNYLKPYMFGDVSVSSTNTSVTVPFNNLGYVPAVRVWTTNDPSIGVTPIGEMITQLNSNQLYYQYLPNEVNINSSGLVFNYRYTNIKYYYRIYLEPIYE